MVRVDNFTHYVKTANCENMLHYGNNLYITCPNLIIYNIFSREIV
jgi:hypothetical protein